MVVEQAAVDQEQRQGVGDRFSGPHGEVEAVPVLLRRFAAEAGVFDVRIGTPIRRRRPEMVREDPLRRAVELARRQPGCSAILVLFDGDDDCPRALAPTIERWASDAAAGVPCAVVMAHREYEAWFLAAIESLVGPTRPSRRRAPMG